MAKQILIVEDEKALAWALAESLRDEGLCAEVVHTCRGAADRCRAQVFDLVITDVGLPDGNGLDLLRRLAGRPPAIVVSALGDAAIRAEARGLGAVAYFQKPFDVERLKAAVAGVLRSARLAR